MTITATAVSPPTTTNQPVIERSVPGRLRSIWHDTVVFTRRNLVHIRREPAQLSDVTIQPVLFTVLFVYIFGSGIPIHGGSYKDFALAGLLSLNLTTSAMGTGVGISADMSTGAIDRFRSLPIWRAAVLVGRSLSDLLAAALCVTIVAVTGLVIGWRPDASLPSIVAGFAIALLFSYSLSWLCACIGLLSKGPESAQGIGLIILFPIAFVSNAMVPTQGMPAWLQTIADWNPVSAVTAAMRDLFGNPNPSGAIHAWPMQNPVPAAIGWAVVILAVCAPLAVHLFRKRTTE
jgi:ABC-2 type transport system permease protein